MEIEIKITAETDPDTFQAVKTFLENTLPYMCTNVLITSSVVPANAPLSHTQGDAAERS
jgi:hypothetical protein